jgi:hypothetical protein
LLTSSSHDEKVLAIDACFKLSLKGGGKKRSDHDPELASGYGVFVNEDEYQQVLQANPRAADVGHVLFLWLAKCVSLFFRTRLQHVVPTLLL